MGLYYFYRNSPKQRQNLNRSFEALSQKPVIPTRVGGTRWLAHMTHAIESFLQGYQAIANHLADVTAQKQVRKDIKTINIAFTLDWYSLKHLHRMLVESFF